MEVIHRKDSAPVDSILTLSPTGAQACKKEKRLSGIARTCLYTQMSGRCIINIYLQLSVSPKARRRRNYLLPESTVGVHG